MICLGDSVETNYEYDSRLVEVFKSHTEVTVRMSFIHVFPCS